MNLQGQVSESLYKSKNIALLSQPPAIIESFKTLTEVFCRGITDTLDPAFYVSPIDCGLGKGELIATFLSEWKRAGFCPSGSVLIAVQTLAEIKALAGRAGLDDPDYAARSADDEINRLGRGVGASDSAPILFTTHNMLRGRVARKSFGSASEFHYRGHPRSFIICDEGILPAEPLSLRVDDLKGLVAPIRLVDAEYVAALEALIVQMESRHAGATVRLPRSFRQAPGATAKWKAVGPKPSLSKDQTELVRTLRAAARCPLKLVDVPPYGRMLIGAGAPFPKDIPPMVILDASARVRATYELWAGHRRNLIMLPPAGVSFSALTVNLWKKAAGIDAMKDPEKRGDILRHVAKVINDRPREKWLVICMKARELDKVDIQAELVGTPAHAGWLDYPENVSFVTWGAHHGINDHKDCKNIIVIGGFNQHQATYQATYAAATGLRPRQLTGAEWPAIRQGELQHNLLQAICRGNVRNSKAGVCGECTVDVVIGSNPDPETAIRAAFPGCVLRPWDPVQKPLSGYAGALLAEVQRRISGGERGRVSKGELRRAIGIDDATGFAQVLKSELLHKRLSTLGVAVENKHFDFVGCGALTTRKAA